MASTFLELETSRACEWCSAPIDMKQELPSYVDKPLYEWDHGLLEDLRHCYDCVEVYHRLEDELIRERPEFKKKLQLLDTQRLKDTVKQAFDLPVERKVFDRSGQDVVTRLQLPLMEMLRYPYFLHHKELATLFVKGLITLNQCESPLKLEEKLPGTYLLLVHPDPEVRGWAIASVRDLGLLNPDDYDFLAEVIGWMINVVQFNLFENINSLIEENDADRELPFDCLPPHLFMELDERFYWQSLFVLIRQMDVSTVQACFMTSQPGHDELLTTILLSMEEQDKSPFWPMLQCFVLLLERLGSRMWQMPTFNYMPTDVFRIITKNWIYSDSITQWQQDNETPNKESKDSKRTRTLSSSSSKIYKTAVAWFDPFVKSFLDFDSGGEIVSKVVSYLHDVADRCSPGSSFRHEVLSHFVRIVNDLLNRRLFSLLVPTVRLWATDVVDVAIVVNGSVDKKVVEVSQRLLQGLLKDCHRKGYKNALKYRDMFQLSGPKFLSSDDKQQIILLLVQNFETQEMPFFRQPGLRNISKSWYELQMLKEFNAKSLMSDVNNGELQMKSTLPFDKMPVDKENKRKTLTSLNQETIRSNRRSYETSAGKGHEKDSAIKNQTKFDKGKVVEASSTTLSTLNDQPRKRKIDSTVGSSRMAGPCGTSLQRSAVKAREEEAVVKHQISVGKGNRVKGRPDALSTPSDQPRKRKIDSTVRSWGKAGPSTQVSDDEEENEVEKGDYDDEESYWTYFKRRKKSKHHQLFGNVKISEKSKLLMKRKPFGLKIMLHDIGNTGTSTVSTSNKPSATDNKIQKTGVKRPLKGKGKYTARKSAGSVKKRPPNQRKRGATAADPIVVSDEEESAMGMLEKRISFSKGDKDPVTENHFLEDDEESVDEALLQMMDIYDAKKEANVSVSQNTTLSNSSLDATSPSKTDRSDDTFKSFVKQEYSISSAAAPQDKPSPVEVKLTAKGCRSDERVETFTGVFYPPNMKAELIETERDTILYPELRGEQLSVKDHKSSGSEDEADEDSLVTQEDLQCPSMSESLVQDEPNDPENINLSSISNQLENATIDDGTNFWDDFCDYSELVLGSQENALVSIEDDLEDVYSTQTQDNQENSIVFLNDDSGHEAYYEPHSDTLSDDTQRTVSVPKAVKRVTFSDNTAPVTTAMSASRSNGVQPFKPAIKTPTRVLKEELFFHEILNWNVSCLGNPKRNIKFANPSPVPEGFDSIDQYYETFTPLLFLEVLEQARKSWDDVNIDKKKVFMNVSDGGASNNLSVIPCIGSISKDQQKNALFPLESDLVVLRFVVNDGRGSYMQPRGQYAQVVFGFVEKADVKPTQSSRRLSLDSDGEDDLSGSREFQLTLEIKTSSKFRPVRGSCIQVEFVTSLLTAMRQFCGLMHFSKSLLASDILKPRKAVYFCSEDYQQSSLVSKAFNQSQEKVISTAANAIHKEFPLPRICLVQGPPGTGKSFTIVGLVREILNRPPKVATQSSSSSGPLADKPRILLCAPSNGAIDELIGQITQALIHLDKWKDGRENRKSNRTSTVKKVVSRNCGDLSLVRVGRKSHIHPSVMKFSLDSLTKEVKERQTVVSAAGDLSSIREKLKIYEHREKELDIEILELKNSPFPGNHSKLCEKVREKQKLNTTKDELRTKYRAEKVKDADSRRQEARIRRDILDSADVVCTTLSGAGSRSLKRDLQRAGRPICPFTCVIIDEACQCTELDVLIALEHKASKLVLVGDPEQLPPTVLSMKAKEKCFGRSLFERLYRFFRHHDIGKPVLMLEEQYRMHPEIASFPSQHVYNSRLKSHSSLANRRFPLDKHYALFDVIRGQETSQERGALWNPAEVEIIADLCSKLTRVLKPERVGIITPYRKQKTELQRKLHDRGISKDGAIIEVNTVDGFQGREKDVIILSCVRAKNVPGSIGFVSDRQRMNVALTRARHALYVFGHMETLKGDSKDWGALIENAQERHCLFPVVSAGDVQSVLSLGVRSDEKSPAKDPRQTGSARRLENTKATPTLIAENQISKKTANGTLQQQKALLRDSSDKVSSFGNNVMTRHAVNSATNPVHISSTNSMSRKEMDRHNARENNSRQRHHQNSAETEAREKNSERRDRQKQPESHANNHHHRHQHVSKRPQFSERKEHQRHHPSYRKEHQKTGRAKHDYAQDNMRHERLALTEQSNKRQKFNGDGVRSLSPTATHHSATAYSLNSSSNKERTDKSQVGKQVVSPVGSIKCSQAAGPSYHYLGSFEDHLHRDARLTAAEDSALQRDTIIGSNSSFLPSFEYEDYLRSPFATSNSPTVSPRSPSETSAGHSTVTQSTSAQQFSRSRRNHNQLPPHEFPQQYGRSFNGKHTTNSPAICPASSTSSTQTSKASSAVASHSMSGNLSELSRPQVSAPSPGSHEAGSTRITGQPSTFSLSNLSDRPMSSHSFGRRSNGLDPGAERAANLVRERHPPNTGPQIISPAAVLFGRRGSRGAHAASREEVERLRQKGIGAAQGQLKKDGKDHSRRSLNRQKAKWGENLRCHTSWNKR